MATFADANNSRDVMNICLAVGPEVSRTIKHFYLRRNKKYLVDAISNMIDIRRLLVIPALRREKAGTNHRAWMEVNTDWKTTVVSDDAIRYLRKYRFLDSRNHMLAFNSAFYAVELGLLEVVKFLIEEKGVNPNEYGWTLCTSTMYRYPPNVWNYRVHLVSAAMTFRREDIFQYLLSLPSISPYSDIDKCARSEARHGLFEQALHTYVSCDEERTYLMMLVNHNRFDVNRACHSYSTFPGNHSTCLIITLYELGHCLDDFEKFYGRNEDPDLTVRDYERLHRYMNAIKLLRKAGASPTRNISSGRNCIELVERVLRKLHSNVGDHCNRLLKQRVFRQVITIMKG